MKSDKGLEDLLRHYKAPDSNEQEKEETIRLAKEMMDHSLSVKTPLYVFLKTQVKFLSPYLWITQLSTIVLLILLAMQLNHPGEEIPKLIFVVSPFLAFIAVPEILKSDMFNMSELEQSSKHGILKIILARTIIVISINIIFLTVALFFISVQFKVPFLQLIIYGLVPLNIVNGVNLLLIDLFKVESKALLTGVYISLIGINYVLVNSKLFLALSYSTWLIIFIVSTVIVLVEIYIFILRIKNRERLQWN